MQTTLLSTLLNRMNRWQAIYRNTEEQYLVYDLDEALRNLMRTHQLPWTLKKTTLRVFDEVLEYPTASDHLKLAILEGQEENYADKPKPYYTSIKEFYEDPNNRSSVAEIWDQATKFLGIRNKNIGGNNRIIDTCELDSGYTISGDITAKAIDNVIYKTGNGSLRLTVVNSTGTGLLEKSFTAFTDTVYKRNYVFYRVFLSTAPTSITLRFGADSSNYLYKTITIQFSGQAFKANDFNYIAIDLNAPDGTTGTVDTSTLFDYYAMQLNGAASGLYYIDEVSYKQWRLMDYWYYSNFQIKTISSSVADQQFFMNVSEIYSTDSELIGPKEFADIIMYDAMTSTIADLENSKVYPKILEKRDMAWDALKSNYPSLEQLITTHRWRFPSQMGSTSRSFSEDNRY